MDFLQLLPTLLLVALALLMFGPMATAISFEIGIHNSTLSLYIALSVLANFQLALPSALYSVSMYLTGAVFGLALTRWRTAPQPAASPVPH